jgi:hypothetical protein
MAGTLELNNTNKGIVLAVGAQRAKHGADLDVVERARPSRPTKRRDDAGDAVMFNQAWSRSDIAID